MYNKNQTVNNIWSKHYSKSRQKEYWFNKKTGESVWKMPQELKICKKRKKNDIDQYHNPSPFKKQKIDDCNNYNYKHDLGDIYHPNNSDSQQTDEDEIKIDYIDINKLKETLSSIENYMENNMKTSINYENKNENGNGNMDEINQGNEKGNGNMGEIKQESNFDYVDKHYNKLKNTTKQSRTNSESIFVKQFNNWVKIVLIKNTVNTILNERLKTSEYPSNSISIADLACGRGGDITKWSKYNIEKYLGVDISINSIRNAIERCKTKKYMTKCYRFICHDISTPINNNHYIKPYFNNYKNSFDIISIQFAIHYLFKSHQTLQGLMNNILNLIKSGGYLIFTTIDSQFLSNLFKETDEYLGKMGIKREINNKNVIFSTDVMKIKIDKKNAYMWENQTLPLFGSEYSFTLNSAVDDCVEYVVSRKTIDYICSNFGFQLIKNSNFINYYYNQFNSNNPLYDKIVTSEPTLGQWHTPEFYQLYVLKKI